ncbi:MAG: hypothetical protein KJP02_01880 [Octadecabacter sp.]|nr:hypothetical protein [Octadecabacter sp.]
MVNREDHALGIEIGGEAVVTGNSWSLELPTGVPARGDYDLGVILTATDAPDNAFSTYGTIVVDTVTTVTVSSASVGGIDGVVSNGKQGSGVTLPGTA